MDLILWRHAEAQLARAGQDDLERPLTAKGRRTHLAEGVVSRKKQLLPVVLGLLEE